MTDQTPLDRAHRTMSARPEEASARLAYYHRLSGAELCLLLDHEPEGDDLSPKVIDLSDGPLVLAFDGEDRLAAFAKIPVPYAALPGRVVIGLLAGQGIGLGINLGDEDHAFLLPAEAVDWLADLLAQAPEPATARPTGWAAPADPSLAPRIADLLSGLGALAAQGWLATARSGDDSPSQFLIIEDPAPGAEEALAKAATEALAFSGADPSAFSLLFLSGPECRALGLPLLAEPVPLSRPAPPPEPAAPQAPGSDPARPPRLR